MLAGTAQGRLTQLDVELQLQSPSDPATVAELVRLADETCFVIQAVKNPQESTLVASLNGVQLSTK